MEPASDPPLDGDATAAPRRRRRVAAIGATLVLGLAVGLVAALAFLSLPLSSLTPRLEAAIEARLPPGYRVEIGAASLRRSDGLSRASVRLEDLSLLDADGEVLFAVPASSVELATWPLLKGRLSPLAIHVLEPELTLARGESGLGLLPPAVASQGGGAGEGGPATSIFDAAALALAMLDGGSELGALEEISIEDAQLRVRRRSGETTAVAPMTLHLGREAEARTIGFRASLGEEGSVARLAGNLRLTAGNTLAADLEVEDLALEDFEPLLPPSLPFEATNALNGRASGEMAASGELLALSVDLDIGGGRLGPAGGRQLEIDDLVLAGEWSRRDGVLRVHPSTLVAGDNRGTLSGMVRMPPPGDFGSGTWPVQLQLTNVRLADPETDWPANFPLVTVEGYYRPDEGQFVASRLDIASPEAAASLVGTVGGGRETPGIQLAGSSAPIPVRALKSLWPPFLGKGARRWVVNNLQEGLVSSARLTVDVRPDEIASALRGEPLPRRAYRIDFDMADVDFSYLGDMPPISGAQATASLDPVEFDLRLTDQAEVHLGRGKILVTGGRFFVDDLRPNPSTGHVGLSLQGGADAIAELLNYEPLVLAARRNLNPADIAGTADVNLDLEMPLSKDVRFADVRVTARGEIKEFRAHGVVGDREVTDGDITIAVADGWMEVGGKAKIDGMPADISLRQPLSDEEGGGAQSVTMTLDEAARKHLGLSLEGLLSGPVEATVRDGPAMPDGGAQKIELDLTKARLHVAEIGLDKPEGQAAKAEFLLLKSSGRTEVEDLVVTAEGLRLEGGATIGEGGGLERLSLPVVRLQNGTDVSVTGGSEGGMHVFRVKGNAIDLRPALQGTKRMAGSDSSGAQSTTRPTRLEIDVKRAIGSNRVRLTDLIGSVTVAEGGLRKVDLSGVVGGGAPATVFYDPSSSPALRVRSGDAGALVSFAGIYENMSGGALDLVAERAGPGEVMRGRLVIDNSVITDDPAVDRLIASGEKERGASGRSPATVMRNGDIRLDRMEAQFAAVGGRIEVRNGLARNAAIGATVEGTVGLDAGRLDLHGTYIPLYAINNLFQQLPLFGTLLGGKRNEGLFGITYSLSGSLDDPDMTINPLSAVTPGVFRYIFGMDNPRAAGAGGAPVPGN
ncbi:DUF3971 domain-containing protein [Lutibaculum baratangense]|uniref:DUF3971 domain-containing protein n=1 Tax=Lutibaculum baratangense AMV1 TaxID=631454 RepID=V4RG14_9HYPH|nr:AsmA-like C-terminal region-containing protein [Lutibaculum baratangense]ESR25086.1 hypothetical protein N177_1960 [Lutibaculum baratangense AMV1]